MFCNKADVIQVKLYGLPGPGPSTGADDFFYRKKGGGGDFFENGRRLFTTKLEKSRFRLKSHFEGQKVIYVG